MISIKKLFKFFVLFAIFAFTSISIIFLLSQESLEKALFEGDENYFKAFNESSISKLALSRPLFLNSRIPNITFQPVSLGMNQRESDKIFKPFNSSICKPPNEIDFQTYSSKCPNGTKVTIFEPNSTLNQHYGELKLEYILKKYDKNYYFSNKSEYGYVSCGKDKSDMFLRNIFNQSVASITRQKEESLKEKYNISKGYKPLTVILFVIDSVSRRGFYRNMPETVKFFNESVGGYRSEISKKFYIYEFLGNNAERYTTRSNMTPFLFGISYQATITQDKGKSIKSLKDKDHYINRQKEKAIWNYFKQKGFVTMHLHDVVLDYLPTVVGRTVLADHQASNFWSLSKQLYKYSDGSNDYQCLGSKLPHVHSLNYLSQFLENYKSYNKFAYIQISAAHDDSGTRLKLSDTDIQAFFEQTLDKYSNNEEDLFVIFASDHGRYNHEMGSLYGKGERNLPFHFVISNRDFIERHEFHNNLNINSRRLLSRYDWYKTLKHVANLPYTNISKNSSEYEEFTTQYESISVLIESANEDRKCKDIGMETGFCLADPYLEISLKSISKESIYQFFLDRIIIEMNSYFTEKINQGCSAVKMGEVLYVGSRSFTLEGKIKPLNILEVFKLDDNSSMIFLIDSSITDDKYFKQQQLKVFDNFETLEKKKESGQGKKTVHSMKKIWSLTRLDIIDPMLKKLNINNCQESTFYNYNFLYTIKGKSCYETCNINNLVCVDHRHLNYFTKFNKEKILEIHYAGELNSLEINNTRLIVGRYDMCNENDISDLAICHCAQDN